MNNYKDNYIVIQTFMIRELKLKGNELILYALIHGFSQDGTSYFYGSLKYLQEQTNLSKESVLNILQKLTASGLLIKKDTDKISIFDKEKKSYGSVHYTMYCTAYSRKQSGNVPENEHEEDAESPAEGQIEGQNPEKTPEESCKDSSSAGQENLPAEQEKDSSRSKKFTGTGQESLPVPVKNLDPIINSESLFKNLSSSEKTCKQKSQEERQAEILTSIQKIFGNTQLFSADFIPRLESFCTEHSVDSPKDYISRTYSLVLKKDVTNLPAYFYKTILSMSNLSLYEFEQKKKQNGQQKDLEWEEMQVKTMQCPVCGTEHSVYEDCPECGLELTERSSAEKIAFRRKIFMLPAEKKLLMNREVSETRMKLGLGCNPHKLSSELNRIYEKYGVV